MAIQDSNFLPLQDALFCNEPQWSDGEDEQEEHETKNDNNDESSPEMTMFVNEQDLWWDDEELRLMLDREAKRTGMMMMMMEHRGDLETTDEPLKLRCDAVEWIGRVVAHYGFAAATAVLAVDYVDRFLCSHCYHPDKPWMGQLVAVTCLSLAAKVEETQVPLLLDFQVEGAKFVFEAKTIQRMELLVLSTLQWQMHPVTPISFIDHVIRRLGLEPSLQVEFLKRSNRILMSLIADSRWVLYLPSALASATMLHVMDQLEYCSNSIAYQNQLFSALITISKEKVSECCKLIQELNICSNKRKHTQGYESPNAVIDAYLLSSSDSSNDSWDLSQTSSLLLSTPEPHLPSSSSSALEQQPAFKRTRFGTQQRLLLDSNVSTSS